MDAEQIIKNALDGKFFTINPERGVTVTHEVSKDHMPAYKPLGMKDICRELGRDPKRRNITRHHSDETKQTVIDMRAAGKPIRDVMEATGLTANQVRGIWNHYRYGGKDQAA